MRKLLLLTLLLALIAPSMAQEPAQEAETQVTAWKLMGAQEREARVLMRDFQEAQANLIKAISEYKSELLLVYKDMPPNAEFNFDTFSFHIPPEPAKKDGTKKEGKK